MQFYVGWPYLRGAVTRLVHGDVNMDTLIAVGTLTAFLAGVADYLAHRSGMRWLDATMILTFVTLGKYLEARTARRAADAVRSIMQLRPEMAWVRRDGDVVELPVAQLHVDQEILIPAGERVPVDAEVIDGQSYVDQSWLTGEPLHVAKTVGDELLAGCLNQQGVLTARVTRRSDETRLAQIVQRVQQVQTSKAHVQRLADRAVAWFVPVVLCIAALAFLLWWLAAADVSQAITSAVAVLVVACPCAMGLATPTAILVGSGRAANQGILFRDAAAIERTASVDTVALDKTGTLTEGKPTVARLETVGDLAQQQWLSLAAACEVPSTHPLAVAIVDEAKRQGLRLGSPSAHETVAGRGIRATVDGRQVLVGNAALLDEAGIDSSNTLPLDDATLVFVAVDGRLAGVLAVQDRLRQEATQLIPLLEDAGLRTLLLSGDRMTAVRSVAHRLRIANYQAEASPEEKAAEIQRLRRAEYHVAMVGDGINDAVALAAADVGISLNWGSDVAIDSADVVIFRDDLLRLVDALQIARATVRIIWQNLCWAFGYNLVLIPIAAGVLVPAGVAQLPPFVAAAAMAASSVSVVVNSLRLRRLPLKLDASR